MHLQDLEKTLSDLHNDHVVSRIWNKDHTVWASSNDVIQNSLGWLDISERIREYIPSLKKFALDVVDSGCEYIVLIGMGASSIGADVLNESFGNKTGYPRLIVLDSIIPENIRIVTNLVNLEKTLFMVCSKSGDTIESNLLYRYFRSIVEDSIGSENAGQKFIAITDEGTPLDKLAHEDDFLAVFLNPPDMGGRYSVLSYFGLLPAVMIGVDVIKILDSAERMRNSCGENVLTSDNLGARFGVLLGVLASKGINKLTIVTSPSIRRFGRWLEQLIAESLGKSGRGIVPVIEDNLHDDLHYAGDRVFVYLRAQGDHNESIDHSIDQIESRGYPVQKFHLNDKYDLGSEFFRWEFSTAVLGSMFSINPFDQPDVSFSKMNTKMILSEYEVSGELPKDDFLLSFKDLLAEIRDGYYLAIMPYVHQTPEINNLLLELSTKIKKKYRIAVTICYGTQFLHSVGQLHKGGPKEALFLQLTANHDDVIQVPGEYFTFGFLANVQAWGDLRVLHDKGRKVSRVHLESNQSELLKTLIADI